MKSADESDDAMIDGVSHKLLTEGKIEHKRSRRKKKFDVRKDIPSAIISVITLQNLRGVPIALLVSNLLYPHGGTAVGIVAAAVGVTFITIAAVMIIF